MNEDDIHDDDRYLWDRSGEPDPEVERLERLLAPLGYRPRPLAPLASRQPGPAGVLTGRRMRQLALAAGIVLVAAASAVALWIRQPRWAVQSVTGAPIVDGTAVADAAHLDVGGWLVTDAFSRARIAVGRIGSVDVDPNTQVQLVEARGSEHRLSLARGTIHARISAPPKFFFVNTPSAVAVDLGCAYTLQVDDRGAGLVRVTSGWVEFDSDGRQSLVPEGAMCATRVGAGPGTPHYEDAPSGYAAALATLDFGGSADPGRAAALGLVLSSARRRDALTLWHLVSRGAADERTRVYDRLAALAPPPSGVTRELVLAGDRRALEQWWDSLGFGSSSWWWLYKKKF